MYGYGFNPFSMGGMWGGLPSPYGNMRGQKSQGGMTGAGAAPYTPTTPSGDPMTSQTPDRAAVMPQQQSGGSPWGGFGGGFSPYGFGGGAPWGGFGGGSPWGGFGGFPPFGGFGGGMGGYGRQMARPQAGGGLPPPMAY